MNRTATLSSAGAALVLTGAALLAGPAFSADDPASNASPRTVTSSSTPVPADVPPVPATVGHAAELTQQLAKVKDVLAAYQLTPAVMTGKEGRQAGPLEFYPIGENSAEGYKATTVLADGAGRATLSVYVRSATKPIECTPANNCVMGTPVPHGDGATSSDSTVRAADGTEVLVTRGVSANGKVTLLAAQAKLADGTVVTANVRAEVDAATGSVTTRDSVPLSEQQLVDVVVRPGFRH
ncbi:hypothetical protein ACIA8G_04135 [Lentzea sp. NPDC051213]|uniref:hypothetical protein n=1 Tax=Lentzea sp. NPDC051213 TaxID=3364126 RepID=UPI0037ACFAF4